jgi:bifunctional NMN adenylyltransferase/nudix hydrolase
LHPAQEQYDVGVLVGRFQVHELHDAHRDLIQYVCDRHEKVIIFLGLAPLPVSTSNPLDFEARKQMILADFPDVNVLYIKDQPSDTLWSYKLDEQIKDLVTFGQSVVLYGGRDSFISHYDGDYPTQELLQSTFRAGTEVRKSIARSRAKASADFRAGVIWASQGRFPTAYQTVDVAILNEDGTQVLLGHKNSDGRLYRFIGGFSDPRSPSLEADVRREVQEEAGIAITDPVYLGSTVVDDWRYRNEPDCIKTALFKAKYLSGRPTPGDDIDEVRWFGLSDRLIPQVVLNHRPLMAMVLDNVNRKEA